MTYSEKIRKIRQQKAYTQEYMAFTIGVSYVTYHNLENGKSDIKFSLLEKCAEALEVSIIELLPQIHIHEYLKKVYQLEQELEDKKTIISSLAKKLEKEQPN